MVYTYVIPETKFFILLEAISSSREIETLFRTSGFNKAVFCLQEKLDILVNNEYSFSYNIA